MNVYVVVQRGVYRHDIIGVWHDFSQAQRGAEEAIAKEEDDYHQYEVVETTLDGAGEDKVVATLQRKMKREPRTDGIRGTVQTSEVEKQWWEYADDRVVGQAI